MHCFVFVDRPCVLTGPVEMNAVFFYNHLYFFNGTFTNMTIQYIAPIHLDGIEFLWQNYHSRGILNYMRGRPEEAITDLKVCILLFRFQLACEQG